MSLVSCLKVWRPILGRRRILRNGEPTTEHSRGVGRPLATYKE